MPIETTKLDYPAFESLIRNSNSFAITTHVNPDGDAIGSEVGLAEWLKSIGKTVHIINHSPTPENYGFIGNGEPVVQQFDEAKHTETLRSVDCILVLDVNDPGRVKSLEPFAREHKNVAVIDHHLEPKDFAGQYFIDTEACSTGELIYRLYERAQPALGGSISPRGAMALYTAIMTDTGGFKFPRTDAKVFRMCAELLEMGADPVVSYNEVFNSSPASRLLLLRESLNSLEYFYDNRMAVQLLTQDQLKSVGATEEEVDGFVQMPFQVGGIVMSVFILQLREGWKMSVRSKGDVSAAALAQAFGGNGHFHAAGARFYDKYSPKEVKDRVVRLAKDIVNV
jgi:bifunctional oligoribonuclease and PAP phosphatase NrnA